MIPSTLQRQFQARCRVSSEHAAASVPSTLPRQFRARCRVSSQHAPASVPSTLPRQFTVRWTPMSLPAVLAIGLAGTAVALLAITPAIDAHRRAALRRVVCDVCRIFEAHRIDYWCDFGTLLGFYRERDIISGDKDADLSILASETPKIMALADVLRAQGYELTDRGGRARKLIRIYEARTRYYLDVYPYVRDGPILRSVLASPQEDIPADLVARRVPASFLGATVR